MLFLQLHIGCFEGFVEKTCSALGLGRSQEMSHIFTLELCHTGHVFSQEVYFSFSLPHVLNHSLLL